MYSELSKAITDLVKAGFPEMESVFRYMARATVAAVDEDAGTATVQPLRPDGSPDDQSPEIPDVPLPRIPGEGGPVFLVPDVGTEVFLLYLYQDPSQPVIVECRGAGHTKGTWAHKGDVKIEGGLEASGSITDGGGNTNHHSH